MFFSSALLAVSTLVGVAQADYIIDPKSVSRSTRQAWCNSEIATCQQICNQFPPGTTITNTCDPDKLTYGCLCGNNMQPNVSEYSLSLPYFTCTEFGNQCVKACGHDNTCSSTCRQDHPCGAQDPPRVNTTSSASTPTSTDDGDDTIFTGTPGSTGTPSKKGAAPSLEIGRTYGLAIVLGSMFVGFAML